MDYTPMKKEMSLRIIRFYCRENHGGDGLCEECERVYQTTVRHLEACRFKELGRPCPACPECCFTGEDRERMIRMVEFEGRHADEAGRSDPAMLIRAGPESPDDPRFDRAAASIKEAFMEILMDSPFSSVTVAQVCRAAGVGRSTFYAHYRSLTDLVDDCVFDLAERMDTLPSQARFSRWVPETSGEPMCMLVRKDPKARALLLDPDLMEHCASKLCEYGMPRLIHTMTFRTGSDCQYLGMMIESAILGCLRMARDHLDESDEEWSRRKEAIDRAHLGGLRMLFLDG